jgi:hypothetical protein
MQTSALTACTHLTYLQDLFATQKQESYKAHLLSVHADWCNVKCTYIQSFSLHVIYPWTHLS